MSDVSTEYVPALHQVWSVVYDSNTPHMDGTHAPVRMHEVRSPQAVATAMQIIQDRSERAPKRNLRVETRLVSDWELDDSFSPPNTPPTEIVPLTEAEREALCRCDDHDHARWPDCPLAAHEAANPQPHPCGHAVRVSGCGGCDPGAVEYVRDDGGPWRRVDQRDYPPEQDVP